MNSYNTFDINSIILSPYAQFEKLLPVGFKHTGIFYCIIFSLLRILKSIVSTLLCAPFKYKIASVSTYRDFYEGKIVFLLPTLNNRRSLNDVVEKVRKKKNNVKVIETDIDYKTYPVIYIDVVSLVHLPSFWRDFKRLNKREKRLVNYFMANYIYTPGVVLFYKRMLSSFKPNCVVLANDHTYYTKTLELVCEDFKIPCVYVQHASVSYAFPELHFSCSFLDGWDSYLKYTEKGKTSRGDIIVLGAGRYDFLSQYRIKRNNRLRSCIGIAINVFDSNEICEKVCNQLLNAFPDIMIKIRMHPSLKEHPFVFRNKERITVTCATDETIISYFDTIDVQIANDSGVHLDAILGGVKTLAFNFSNNEYGDNYEYLKNGLIHLARDYQDLIDFIKDPLCLPNDINKIRYYDDSYGKKYEGHCSDIIADYLISDNSVQFLKDKYNMKVKIYGENMYFTIPE